MTLGGTVIVVWMALVIHVVEQADRLPKFGIGTVKRREMSHRIGHRIAMSTQAVGLDPFVKDLVGTEGEAHGI
jgi:hypothetical protein